MTEIIPEIKIIRENIKEWKSQGLSIGFVPTMGALHAGHESLIKAAKNECDKVIVSIFVNPIQFAPNEDFDKYPRQLQADKIICENNNVDIIFYPTAEEMYPDKNQDVNNSITAIVPPENFQDKLCGKSRIGHFNGVATVVLKLFNIVKPDKAYFGQKDAQQFLIIKKMIKDLNLSVEIIGCPTIRDADGLALSSRNAYLSEDERQKALSINNALTHIRTDYDSGIISAEIAINSALLVLDPQISVEYFEVLDINTFSVTETLKENTLIALAARVGSVRLIDNLLL